MATNEDTSVTSVARWSLWFGAVLLATASLVYSQVTWTPIYVGGHSGSERKVDLWTQSTTGCACSFNSSSNECACCVPSGGCSCGTASPNRCAQCGLEQHCANMCNITLDSRLLFSKSDRGFGQIKSPYLEGPSRCTYRFVPDTGQRVELQIYRLVSIGRHNGSACQGGWLQFEGGARVCGRNKRFDRPVVLFSDKPVATLHMHHCTSDYIAVYSGPTTSSPLLKMLCGKEKASMMYNGQEVLVEFRAGPEVSPFDYNGFVATVNFIEITTEIPNTITPEPANKTSDIMKSAGSNFYNVRYNNRDTDEHRKDQGSSTGYSCDLEVNGEKVRSGHHDTRGKIKSTTCRLVLRGGTYHTGHVSLTSYNLSAQSCQSMIEIFDGIPEGGIANTVKSLVRICSPAQRLPREFARRDEYVEPKRYSSNGRDMTVVLRRATNNTTDEEYMDVSYYFHNEREGGTQQPGSLCDVEYYGLTSLEEGTVVHPEPHRLFAVEGPAKCKQHFIPATNQSVIITVESSSKQISNNLCETKCGDSGCHCVSNKSLENMDHLLLVSETGHVVTCLCGNYQDWLPVGIRSWTPVYIEWSRFSMGGLNFRAAYKFVKDTYCGDHTTRKLEGEVNGGDLAKAGLKLNQYYQQKCTWILESLTDRQITIEVKSNQSRPCTAWNLTIHKYNENGDPAGERLHTFCSRDVHKNFTLPWKENTAVVRLQALGRTAPQYTMKWRSHTVIANTRQSGPSPAPNHITDSSINIKPKKKIIFTFLLILLLIYSIDC
ncbi:uncharacterized protein LOC124951361 isoform X2 [Vespa velutina]|uniref:uncharacterized protein LOC124951361 isoform X2 n=1 Tax=Vespa velutina TaxID=202808 RepID=UPI001FB31881|nr:uncharacterized protein LOC124951361 isoform X2 [Vespa velutina]